MTVRIRRSATVTAQNIHICCTYICTQGLGHSIGTQLTNFSNNCVDIVLGNADDNFIILGDFNMPNVTWISSSGGTNYMPRNILG